jgi:hypothetical protein
MAIIFEYVAAKILPQRWKKMIIDARSVLYVEF